MRVLLGVYGQRAGLAVGWFLLAAFVLLGSACSVQLVADYDPQTDQAVSALQRKIEGLFVDLEATAGTPQADYANYADFYRTVKVDISAIDTRARARPKNELTVEQVALLRDSLDKLEQIHKIGIADPAVVAPLRAQFSSAFVAILKLEMAKRRTFERGAVAEQ